jgi:dCMP deaminase
MGHARLAALRSTCSRLHVGAVAALDGRILVTGYNGAPAGTPHCDHDTCTCGKAASDKSSIRIKYHDDSCNVNQHCRTAVHAEANLVAFAARHGVSLVGADIFTTDSPCLHCSQLLLNCGIVRVVFHRKYRVIDGLEILKTGGIQVEQMSFDGTLDLII